MAHVLMIGPASSAKGGIATWIAEFRRHAPDGCVDYLETFDGGSLLRKLKVAATGYREFCHRGHSARILHIHTSSHASFWRKLPYYWLGAWRGQRLIAHIHAGDFAEFYRSSSRPVRALIRRTLDLCSAMIALSRSSAVFLESISSAPVHVIPNAVDVHAIGSGETWPWSMVFLGKVSPGKGLDDLLRAIAMQGEAHPPIPLTIFGEGEVPRYQQLAKELGIASHVTFAGWIEAEQKPDQLRAHGIFALPSHREGLPIALLEAMAAARPVLTTTVGGIPEAVEDEVQGFVLPPGRPELLADRICRLSDPELRARLGRAARARAEQDFDWGILLGRLIDLYRSLGTQCPI